MEPHQPRRRRTKRRTLITGRLVFALIGLALAAVPAYVVKTVVMHKADEVTKEVGFEHVPADPTDIDASESLYRVDNFGEALAALEEHAGPGPELLKVGVLPYMVEFQIRDDERARATATTQGTARWASSR